MYKPGRPVTVEMLIDILKLLPKDALVWQLTWNSNSPMDRAELEPKMGPLMVYERDGEVRLYIDDQEAFHPDVDPYTSSLFCFGGAMAMVIK